MGFFEEKAIRFAAADPSFLTPGGIGFAGDPPALCSDVKDNIDGNGDALSDRLLSS